MDLVRRLATTVTGLSRLHDRVLVGIDGPDGASKTTLAGRLSDALRLPTQQACVDGFARRRAQRYRRGELSPDGYYLDSFDYQGLRNACLLPFLGGQPVVRTSGHERDADSRADVAVVVPPRAVLVVDGVFLLRPELRELWTLSVYLRVSAQETLRRAHRRDLELFGTAEQVQRRYLGRYLPGQVLYRLTSDPEALADLLVDNERTGSPRIERWSLPGIEGRP
jgi:uridine kinase